MTRSTGGDLSAGEPGSRIERLLSRAQELLGDVPGVEGTLDAAEARVARHRELAGALDPMVRLVRSYVRGTFRDADRGDVVLALGAALYVRSPLDLVPDFAPGGLVDDERVVAWVAERISDTLSKYVAWEDSLGAAREGEESPAVTSAAGPGMLPGLEVRVLDAPDSSLFTRIDGTGREGSPAVAVGPFVGAAAEAAHALTVGKVMQVLGPADLVKGLKSGTYQLMQTASGQTGTVMSQGKMVGNLRFGNAQPALAAGVLAGFELASAVTFQYYLARIDRQLGEIERQVRGIRQDLLDACHGSIDAAREGCADLEESLAGVGALGDQDGQRLAHAEARIDEAYHELSARLVGFERGVEALFAGREVERAELARLLEDGTGIQRANAQLLLYAAVVRHRLNGLAVIAASQESPERAEVAVRKLERERREMLERLAQVGSTFAALRVPKRELDRRWSVRGAPERELAEYLTATTSLRDALAQAPAGLPPMIPEQPFVYEILRRSDGELVERQALIDTTAATNP